MKNTNKVRLSFLNSIDLDIQLYKRYPRYSKFDSGQSNYELFLGHLKEEILTETKGKNKAEKDKAVKLILEREYAKHKEMLSGILNKIKEEWSTIGPTFIKACETTFEGNPFPSGEYRAIMTIWSRFPCIQKTKTFYFPAYTPLSMLVITHELLHFAFFSYFNKHFKGRLKKERTWVLAEVFNILIMNEEPYLTWAKMPSKPYPAHHGVYERLLPIFKERSSMKEFIEKAILALKE